MNTLLRRPVHAAGLLAGEPAREVGEVVVTSLNRDYPIMFGTLYFFGLIGLVMGILGDIMYTVVDPRIDFESLIFSLIGNCFTNSKI